MDVEELLKCLETLGIHLNTKSDIQGSYLGVLEEVSIKIQKVSRNLNGFNETTSAIEIQCYERYLSSLSLLIIRENTSYVMHLLRLLQKRIKFYAKFCCHRISKENYEKIIGIIKICKRIENDMRHKKSYFGENHDFWILLYRIIKYENILRIQCGMYLDNE
ncbi:hypothetical protein SteCoe_2775 [Stentor coeruleus]|uniref:Uncharacterized protein n=1 Tax=Stentor coeruleus TaxID=5963 RepID=A0A1R2CYQ4_9CILI|nr:hypothetical protein SteCoe_2775 [Stentor coeruleus]